MSGESTLQSSLFYVPPSLLERLHNTVNVVDIFNSLMPPDHSNETENGSRAAARTVSPNKRTRGKTAKAGKKKRNWSFFSRWNTDINDEDDELELFLWCKKRGLTSNDIASAPVSATVPRLQQRETRGYDCRSFGSHHTQANASKIAQQLPAKEKRIVFEVKPYQEAVFLSKLCSSITDKRLFMNQSKVCKETTLVQDIKRDNPLDTRLFLTSSGQPRHAVTTNDSETSKDNDENSVTIQDCTTVSKVTIEQDCKDEDKSFENGYKKSCDGRVSAAPGNFTKKISLERNSEIKYENLRYRNIQKRICDVYTSPPAVQKKEWNSDVENEILRLYESTNPKSSLVCDWTLPQTENGFNISSGQLHRNRKHDYAFAVERSVESRLARADQTPNYVLALANMFRRRLQIRNECSQILKESIKVQVGSGADNSSSDNLELTSTGSPAHLRYHHVDEEPDELKDKVVGVDVEGTNENKEVDISDNERHLATNNLLSNINLNNDSAVIQEMYKIKTSSFRRSKKRILSSDSRSSSFKSSSSGSATGKKYEVVIQKDSKSENQKEIEPSGFGINEIILNSLTARLDKEEKEGNENLSRWRLQYKQETPPLQRPTPVLPHISEKMMRSKCFHALSRGGKRALYISNSSPQRDKVDNARNSLRDVVGKHQVKSNNDSAIREALKAKERQETFVKYVSKTLPIVPQSKVRWPASVGTLYNRPSSNIFVNIHSRKQTESTDSCGKLNLDPTQAISFSPLGIPTEQLPIVSGTKVQV